MKDPFDALAGLYRGALNPFQNADHLRRLSERLQAQLDTLQNTQDPAKRLDVLNEMIHTLTTPLFTRQADAVEAFRAVPLPPWWASVQSMSARVLAETLAGRTEPLSLSQWLRMLTDSAEAAYQSHVRSESFAKSIADAWRFWPTTHRESASSEGVPDEPAVKSSSAPKTASAAKPQTNKAQRSQAKRSQALVAAVKKATAKRPATKASAPKSGATAKTKSTSAKSTKTKSVKTKPTKAKSIKAKPTKSKSTKSISTKAKAKTPRSSRSASTKTATHAKPARRSSWG
jgi:hypothetical protein